MLPGLIATAKLRKDPAAPALFWFVSMQAFSNSATTLFFTAVEFAAQQLSTLSQEAKTLASYVYHKWCNIDKC